MLIATGEEPEDYGPDEGKDQAAMALGRKGGAARAAKMAPGLRAEIGKKSCEEKMRRLD